MFGRLARTVLLILIAIASKGQSTDGQSIMTLSDAFDAAKQNYPSIKLKMAEKESALYELKASQNNYLPNFTVQGQVTDATSNQVRGTFFPNEGTAIPTSGGIKVNGYTSDAVWTSFATGLVNWKFFSFGKYRAVVNTARAGMTAAEADYQNELFQHMIKVGDAYLVALITQNMLASQRANVVRVKALRDVTVSYSRSGIKPGVDSSLVNAEYSKALLQFLEAQRIAREQKVYLKELLGMTGAAELMLDTMTFVRQTPQAFDIQGNTTRNPRLILYKSLVEFNQAKVASFKRRELPSFSLLVAGWARGSGISDKVQDNGDFTYNSSFGAGVPFRAYNYMVGVSTIWNITTLLKTSNEAKVQRSVAHMAEERLNEESLAVESELERARLRYQAALEASRQAPIQLGAARDAYEQARARYQSGLSTILELTQTYALLNRAEVDSFLASGNVWRAILMYSAATGDLEVFTKNLN